MTDDNIETVDLKQRPENCDCGFPAEVCKTNPCMRKKMATSGLNPEAKYPYCGAGGVAQGPRQPTEAMLNAAREWSREKYGKPIGNDGAIGCWQAMFDASLVP